MSTDTVFGPLFEWPLEQSCLRQIIWVAVWPMRIIFFISIPDCERPRYKRWFALTFIMCIIWIGSLSYVVAWMITIIGKHIKKTLFFYFLFPCLKSTFTTYFFRRYFKNPGFSNGYHVFSSRHQRPRSSVQCNCS